MTSTPEDLEQFVSDEDREAAVARLREAFAEGLLTHEEMDERLQTALSARSRGDLVPAFDRLPAPSAGAVVAAGGPVELKAKSGRIKREGAWRVPRTLTVENQFGGVTLDLSRALIEYPVIDIELRLEYGSASIVLPRDATVDYDGLVNDWKQTAYKPGRGVASPTLHVRVTGRINFGKLKISHAR